MKSIASLPPAHSTLCEDRLRRVGRRVVINKTCSAVSETSGVAVGFPCPVGETIARKVVVMTMQEVPSERASHIQFGFGRAAQKGGLQVTTKHTKRSRAKTGGLTTAAVWEQARDRFYSSRDAAEKAGYEGKDGQEYYDALEAWEALTPPDIKALAEVMAASINFGIAHWTFQSADCPRTMRDLLDGGDAGEIFAARYYLHVLRMAGSPSAALSAAPIAGLFPKFEGDGDAHDAAKAWDEHHRTAEPNPSVVRAASAA